MVDDGRSSRRACLRGGAALVSGIAAGCVSTASEPVSVLGAGSLAHALEGGLRPAVDPAVRIETRGSVAAARLVATGRRDPDVVSLADVGLFDAPLDAAWYAAFATNALVLAYDPDSAGGRAVASAGPDEWYRPLVDGDVRLGRTDPDLDPLGYRTLFALSLATDHYDTDADLRTAVPDRGQVYPETQLVSRFETGSVDAAFVYRSMAVDRGYPYVDLPRAVDLSDPRLADRYATASYRLHSGRRVVGDAIAYGSTRRSERRAGAVRDVFDALVDGDFLGEYGLTVPDHFPRFAGDSPDDVA